MYMHKSFQSNTSFFCYAKCLFFREDDNAGRAQNNESVANSENNINSNSATHGNDNNQNGSQVVTKLL